METRATLSCCSSDASATGATWPFAPSESELKAFRGVKSRFVVYLASGALELTRRRAGRGYPFSSLMVIAQFLGLSLNPPIVETGGL